MDTLTKNAVLATLHCLLGCSIGEILGMVIGSVYRLDSLVTVIISIGLAFLFGYSLTFFSMKRSGMRTSQAAKATLVSDTLSITSMEIVDNLVILIIPGAMAAGLNSGLFWGSLVLSLAIAFCVTIPVNRLLMKRGLGHAHIHHHSEN